MKKLTPFLISSLLLFGAAACNNVAKTSQSAPNNVDQAPPTPNAKVVEASKEDAQSEVRRRQLNADIEAREHRNNWTGGDTNRAVGDLESEVRSKVEANIPYSQLAVKAEKDGTVIVSGTVKYAQNIAKIEPLAKEIKGVKNVIVKATVAQVKEKN